MALPNELWGIPEETAVVGDIDAFMAYCEDGRAYKEWIALMVNSTLALEAYGERDS